MRPAARTTHRPTEATPQPASQHNDRAPASLQLPAYTGASSSYDASSTVSVASSTSGAPESNDKDNRIFFFCPLSGDRLPLHSIRQHIIDTLYKVWCMAICSNS